MRLVLHTPPISTNQLYRGRRFLTREGKSTKEKMAWEAKAQCRGQSLLSKEIALSIHFFTKDRRGDIDNFCKGLLDSLKGIVWNDDRQIVELHLYREVDKKKPRIELDAQHKTAL